MTNRAFTLVELLIYLAITSGMLVSFIYFTIGLMSSTENINQDVDIIDSARLINNFIIREVKNADDILEPALGQTSNRLRLGSDTRPDLTLQIINGAFVVSDDINNSWPLSLTGVNVDSVKFTRLGSTLGKANLNVDLKIGNYNWRSSVNQKLAP